MANKSASWGNYTGLLLFLELPLPTFKQKMGDALAEMSLPEAGRLESSLW